MLKILSFLILIGVGFQLKPDSVILFHENGKKWIECNIDGGILEGKAKIYDLEENLIFEGQFSQGMPVDTAILDLTFRKEIWIYEDSLNYINYLFYGDTLGAIRHFENGFHTYDLFVNKTSADTSKVVSPSRIYIDPMDLDGFKKLSYGLMSEIEMEKDLNNY